MASPLQEPSGGGNPIIGRFAESRTPRADVLLLPWCLGDYRGEQLMAAFVGALIESEAFIFLAYFWRASHAASLGRFALSTHDRGTRIAVQIAPDPETRSMGVVDEAQLDEALNACGFIRSDGDDLPSLLPTMRAGMHSLHSDYCHLSECLQIVAYRRPRHTDCVE
jgi:hypothetical protein